MFVALKIVKENPSLLKKILGFRRDKITVIKNSLTNNLGEYYLITYNLKRKEPNFSEIARIAGREKSRLVLAEDIILKEDCAIDKFFSVEFERILLLQGLKSALKRADIPPTKIHLTFIDRNADFKDEILNFLPYSLNIRVVTDKISSYDNISKTAMKKYGAPLIFSENLKACKNSNIIVTSGEIPKKLNNNSFVFSPIKGGNNFRVITPSRVKIPREVCCNIDGYFNKDYFYSAIFELNKTVDKSKILPKSYLYMNREISDNNLVKMLKDLDNLS